MEYREEDFLLLSGIQHFAFCRRHVIITRGMPVFSKTLGVNGVCDIVEFHKSSEGVKIFGREGLYRPSPVEYKRGKPKDGDYDALQLCAQAICLEEMLLYDIPKGFIFYAGINRRQEIPLSNILREKVRNVINEMHQYYERRYTPKVKPSKSCKACSLSNICIPKLNKNLSVSKYINKNLMEECE